MNIKNPVRDFVSKRIPKQTPEWISRGYTLFFILFLSIVFGGITLIPSIISSIHEEKWIGLLMLAGAYATILVILFKKNINYYVRSYVLCFAIVAVGITSMYAICLLSSARLWFLCSTALACLLIGGRSAIIVFIMSFIILVGFGFKHGFEIKLPSEPDHIVWIITSTTFVLVNILVVGSIYLIVSGLKKAEKQIRDSDNSYRALYEKLADRLRHEEVLALCSQDLLKGGEDAIQHVLARLLDATKVGRVFIFENFFDSANRLCTRHEYEAVAQGVTPEIDNPLLQDFSYVDSGFGRWVELLDKGEHIDGNIDTFPQGERNILESQGIVSTLILPITVGGKWWGFAGFDELSSKREWLEEEIRLLRVAAELIGSYIDRKQTEEGQKKLQAQLIQARKIESIGTLAGGVAHDLNNLLSPIIGYSEMLRDDLDSEDARRDSMDEIISAGLRARDLVRQLLAFSRKQILEFKPVNLNKVAAGLEKLLQRTIREDIQMEFDLTSDAGVVMADIGQIEQVIMNLSVNAADAMPEGGKLTIETNKVYLDEEYTKHHQSAKPGEYMMLAISDSGYGMDEATREKIFEPFFSTKGDKGTGLGLATVYGIVKQHGGNIWVYSEPGKGSTFKIYLPVVETFKSEENSATETTRNLKGSETILIVEDSDQVRRLAGSVLERNGYKVLTAKDGAEALEAMATHDRPVNLLLTDVVLPGMNGREIYEKAAETFPSVKVLYMSGYTDNVIAHRGVLDEGVQFIQKPFTVHGLAAKVREVLDEKLRK